MNFSNEIISYFKNFIEIILAIQILVPLVLLVAPVTSRQKNYNLIGAHLSVVLVFIQFLLFYILKYSNNDVQINWIFSGQVFSNALRTFEVRIEYGLSGAILNLFLQILFLLVPIKFKKLEISNSKFYSIILGLTLHTTSGAIFNQLLGYLFILLCSLKNIRNSVDKELVAERAMSVFFMVSGLLLFNFDQSVSPTIKNSLAYLPSSLIFLSILTHSLFFGFLKNNFEKSHFAVDDFGVHELIAHFSFLLLFTCFRDQFGGTFDMTIFGVVLFCLSIFNGIRGLTRTSYYSSKLQAQSSLFLFVAAVHCVRATGLFSVFNYFYLFTAICFLLLSSDKKEDYFKYKQYIWIFLLFIFIPIYTPNYLIVTFLKVFKENLVVTIGFTFNIIVLFLNILFLNKRIEFPDYKNEKFVKNNGFLFLSFLLIYGIFGLNLFFIGCVLTPGLSTTFEVSLPVIWEGLRSLGFDQNDFIFDVVNFQILVCILLVAIQTLAFGFFTKKKWLETFLFKINGYHLLKLEINIAKQIDKNILSNLSFLASEIHNKLESSSIVFMTKLKNIVGNLSNGSFNTQKKFEKFFDLIAFPVEMLSQSIKKIYRGSIQEYIVFCLLAFSFIFFVYQLTPK